jgi:CSLREA domain-containing protein
MTRRVIARLVFALVILASLFYGGLGIRPACAAGITVNTAADEATTNGSCSLREAIINANNDAASKPDCAAGSGIDSIAFAGNYTITLAGTALPSIQSAIVINGNGAGNTIIQANASPNTATYAVFLISNTADVNLNGLTVRNGRCDGTCNGGGIANAGTLTVANSTLTGNSAGAYGGAIENDGTLTVTNSTLSGNSAKFGGAIHSDFANLTITNSVLSGNAATSAGGAISTYAATVSVTNSTLSGNSSENGGGIYNGTNSDLGILGTTLTGNIAGVGGGIFNHHNLWFANSTLSGNTAYDYGGGTYSDGSAWFYNSSVVFNVLAEGTDLGAGGIDGDVAVYNSIVAGNTRAISSTYRDCSGTIYSEGRNLFWNTTNCTINVASGSWGYLNALSFLGPLQNNGGPTWTHALLYGSNAIDTGHDDLCAFFVYNLDQRGVTRPQGTHCDVGAFEYRDGIFSSGFEA